MKSNFPRNGSLYVPSLTALITGWYVPLITIRWSRFCPMLQVFWLGFQFNSLIVNVPKECLKSLVILSIWAVQRSCMFYYVFNLSTPLCAQLVNITNCVYFPLQFLRFYILPFCGLSETVGISRDAVEYSIVEVKDNGIGFEQSYAEKIFEPFQRVNSPGRYEGSGVGLAIVKRVMEKHGSQIEVTSTPGARTKFSLLFPNRS